MLQNEKNKHVKSEFGHDLKPILGCKTCWNSLFDMVEHFVKLSKCIKMLSKCSLQLTISDSELLALKDLVKALKPVKIGAEALCCRDSNFLTAGKVFCFVLSQLQSYV